MKGSHFLSKNVFWEKLYGISEMVHARAFKPLPLSSATHENLPVAISKAPGMQDNYFLSKNVFWENAVRYLRNDVC